jgi:hypothetical protein
LSAISYVGFRTSTQPTNIKQLPKYDFSERNPTNHAAEVFVQALITQGKKTMSSIKMRLLRYLFLTLLVLVIQNTAGAETCCVRVVGTQIAGPPSPARFAKTTWDSVFTSRVYGGGPLLKCPEIEMSELKTFLEYRFVGSLTIEETPRMESSTLHMQLVDVHRGTVVKEGRITWHCVDWRAGACSQTLKDNVMTLAKSFHPLDELIYNYERIPERATIEPEKDPIMSGKKMTVHLTDIRDSKGRTPQPWQRLLVKAEKGKILNGKQQEEYRVFKVGGGVIDLDYQAPDECKKDTETITIYNTCVIAPQSQVTPEREIASEKFDILCDRWEGTITYTEQVSGIYKEHKANRLYSMTIKATFDLKEADEDQIRYESEDAYIDLHDSFQQTALGGLQESWNAGNQGRIPVKVSLEFLPKAKDDPSDLSWYNVAFGEWEGSPVIYTYKSKIPLFGQDCKGRSELTHGALYVLEDMSVEMCTYKDKQTLLTGDYSWNDPLGPSVNPETWDCPDRMGLPVGIPNMIYHKHLKWKIQKLSK